MSNLEHFEKDPPIDHIHTEELLKNTEREVDIDNKKAFDDVSHERI